MVWRRQQIELASDGNRKYVGGWKNDLPHGQGTMTWSDGRKYAGEFKKGEPNGHRCYLVLKDGSFLCRMGNFLCSCRRTLP
ncbi:hypothetical protein [Candidatus Magnetobacterium casense]|uniref:hypothetical protein n=1 Tax=Candidatus Magnetobacterium casense TaxID=1455061 RepID=UPI0009DD6C76